jgi:hypothetical protein
MKSQPNNSTGRPAAEPRKTAADLSPRPPFKARPLVVRPREARRLLGNIGSARLWEMINGGVLDSFLTGRSRFISVESIERYVLRHLAEARDECGRLKLYSPTLAAPAAADTGSVKAREPRQTNTDQAPRGA